MYNDQITILADPVTITSQIIINYSRPGSSRPCRKLSIALCMSSHMCSVRYCLVETVFNGNLARASCTKVLNHINPVSTHLHKPAC